MIKLFEDFTNKIKLSDYIIKEDDVFKIPNAKFENFGEYFFNNPRYYVQIKYNSLIRFYLYEKLLRYKGDSPTILTYIDGLKNKDPKSLEIINKIPNNNNVRNMINSIFKFDFPNHDYSNLQDLKKLISNYDAVFSDRYLVEYINIVFEVSEKAAKSEKIVKGMLNMLYGKYYEITYAKLKEDLSGMDLWKINKITGVRQSVQVKNITGRATFNVKEDMIYIDNSNLDLHPYESWKEKNLPYDYLCFYIEKEKKICLIKTSLIYAIDKYESKKDKMTKRTIRIKFHKWGNDPKFRNFVFKIVDVPAKFTGKDVSQIFYTPEMEQEVKNINPDFVDKD